MGHKHTITMNRKELIAKLAVVAIRVAAALDKENGGAHKPVARIATFVNECSAEFDLSNDEQIMFLRFIVCGKTTTAELLEGEE